MTDRYAVIGNPIGHTKSPLIHGLFADAKKQDMEYTAIEGPTTPERGFEEAVLAFRDSGGRGMNVTAPFKLRAALMADERSERASLAGAANALKFSAGRILAENFDGIGLLRDIEVNLGLPLAGRRVLMLGAGGAARGALLPFLAAAPVEMVLVNRDIDKAVTLARQVASKGPIRAAGYRELEGMGSFDLVVNATSASLTGDLPPVPPSVFGGSCTAYELVYGKGLTPFLRLARNAGVREVADGVGMLVEQAAEAFDWWRGVRPKTDTVIGRLTVPLD
jgi:shikimate dehydrogenase